MGLLFKMLSGMANSVDLDQTAPLQSDLGLHCLHMPFCQKLWCLKFWDIYHSLHLQIFYFWDIKVLNELSFNLTVSVLCKQCRSR